MKRPLASMLAIGAFLSCLPAWSADQIIRLTECHGLTIEDLHTLARDALTKRRYNIEEDTAAMLVGENDDLKVEILIQSDTEILIRWKEGFGHRRDQWLRNLKTDILWELAE